MSVAVVSGSTMPDLDRTGQVTRADPHHKYSSAVRRTSFATTVVAVDIYLACVTEIRAPELGEKTNFLLILLNKNHWQHTEFRLCLHFYNNFVV